MKPITVTVDGGLVEGVTGIPPGVSVRVVDFDAGQGIDDENSIEVDGRRAWVSEYEGPPSLFECAALLWVVYSQYDGAVADVGPAHATYELAIEAMWAALEEGTGETRESILGRYDYPGGRAKIERGDVLIEEFDPSCPDWLYVGKNSMRVLSVLVPAELLRRDALERCTVVDGVLTCPEGHSGGITHQDRQWSEREIAGVIDGVLVIHAYSKVLDGSDSDDELFCGACGTGYEFPEGVEVDYR